MYAVASSGRDRVVIIWDLQTLSSIRTIPVMEVCEVFLLLIYEKMKFLDSRSTCLSTISRLSQAVKIETYIFV